MPRAYSAKHVLSPLSISPPAFMPEQDTYDFAITDMRLKNSLVLTLQYFHAPVFLPHGVTVTKVTLYGGRGTVGSELELWLYRCDRAGNHDVLASVAADWTGGYGSIFDDTINNATIDNENYSYTLRIDIDPETTTNDAMLTGVKIDFS